MKRSKILITFALLILSLPLFAQDGGTNTATTSPSDQLQQLTVQLQNSPDDEALRERIIALALTVNPKPATPDAVTMAEGAAEYAFKNAQTNSDFSDAAKQYEKALLLAPWLAADYFNCGVAHEKAGEYDEAIRNFNLYLLAAPDADDAIAVKKRIGGLQYAEQKQVSDAATKAAADAAAAQAQAAAAAQALATSQANALLGLVWTDPSTGLMWAKKDNGYDVTMAQALDYCRNLNLGGFKDWRLPTISELQSIYDDTSQDEHGRHIKGGLEPAAGEWMWSSSPGDYNDSAWAFLFTDGRRFAATTLQGTFLRALCVRNAGQ